MNTLGDFSELVKLTYSNVKESSKEHFKNTCDLFSEGKSQLFSLASLRNSDDAALLATDVGNSLINYTDKTLTLITRHSKSYVGWYGRAFKS